MTARPGSFALPLAIAALLGAIIGSLIVGMAGGKPLFREVSGQELGYYVTARAFHPSTATEPPAPVAGPLYARLLSLLGPLQDGPAAARRVQLVALGLLLPLLAGLAGRRHFGRRAGMAAAVLTLLLGGVWVHLSWLAPAGWQAAVALAALAIWPRDRDAGPVTGLVTGLLIGLSRLLGAAWSPLWLALLVVGLLARRRWATGAALALGAIALFCLPLMVRLTPYPFPAPIIMSGGLDAESGLHDGASGIEPRRGERGAWRWLTQRDLALEKERAAGHVLPPATVSRQGLAQSLRWMVGHPVSAAGLIVRKAWLMASGTELASPDSLRFRASQLLPWAGPLLWLSPVVMALGLTGLLFAPRRHRDAGAPHRHGPGGRSLIATLFLAALLASAFSVVRTADRLAILLAMTGPAAAALAQWLPAPATGAHPEHRATPRGPLLMAGGVFLALMLLPAFLWAPKFESEAEDRFLLGTALERLGRPAEALAEYDRAIRRDPRHAAARLARVASQARDGLYDVATKDAEDVAGQYPRILTVWNLLSRLYQAQNRFAEASAAYQRLVELDPYNPEAWNNLGTMYATLGQYEPAVDALKKALKLDPNYRSAYINLTEIQKRGPEGLAGATPVVGGGGGGLPAEVAAVRQLVAAGRVDEAERALAALRKTYGSGPDIDLAAAGLAIRRGDFTTAISLFERVKATRPGDPALLNDLAAAYAQSGQTELAIPIWEQLLQINPDNAMIRANLDRARSQSGAAPRTP